MPEKTQEELDNNKVATWIIPWINDWQPKEIKTPQEPVKAEVITTESVAPTPEPIIEPKVEVAPIIEPKVATAPIIETPKIEEIKAPEPTKIEPVEDIQAIKASELANKTTEDAMKETENKKALVNFQAALKTGNKEDIANLTKANPDLRDSFNSMVRWEFKTASSLQYFGKYSAFTNEQLLSAVKNWDIVVWSERYNQLPEEQRKSFEVYKKQDDANNALERNDFTSDNTNIISLDSKFTQLKWVFSSDLRTQYEEAMNSSEITQTAKDLENQQNEINKVNDLLDLVEDEVKAQYPNLTRTQQASIIADRQKSIGRTKNTLINEYNSKLGTYQSLKDNAQLELDFLKYEDQQNKDLYLTALWLYETRRSEMREDEQVKFIAENQQLTADLKFTRDIALLDYKNKIAKENIKWDWIKRDDGLYFAKQDWSIDKVLWTDNPWWVTSEISFTDGTPYSEVYNINNQWTGFNSSNTSLWAKEIELLNAPNWTQIPTRLNKEELSPHNPWGKECGEYVNDIVAGTVWSKIGSTWKNKTTYASESVWEIWSVAVWQIDPSNKEISKYGHAGIIIWETGDKKQWLIKSSNIKGRWTVSLVKVPKTAISGYKTTNIIGKEKPLNQSQLKFLDTIDVKDYANKKETKETATSLWLTSADVYDYKSKNITNQKTQEYRTALQQIDKMMEAWGGDGFSDAIWLFSWERDWSLFWQWARTEWGQPVFDKGTDAADFASQFASLVDALTLPNLDAMSWTLTDKDIALLRNASTGWISMDMSESEFLKSVEALKWALNRAIEWKPIPEWKIIHTDSDWIQYSRETFTQEIERVLREKTMTTEEVKQYILDNNIKL